MGQGDITLHVDGGIVNIRTGAIIMKNGRVLMVTNDHADYFYSVGGRVKFGESAEETIAREVFEETGVHMEVDRLGFVHENFFYGQPGDGEERNGRLFYEIAFFFYMKVPDDFEPVCASFTDNCAAERLVWLSPDDESVTIYPDFYRTELANPSQGVKHFITDGRKNK